MSVDAEIQEAEDFLTEDQLNVIKSIVDDEKDLVLHEKTREEIKWNEMCLRPTLESLGLSNKFNENSSFDVESNQPNTPNGKLFNDDNAEGIDFSKIAATSAALRFFFYHLKFLQAIYDPI
jgi:hypothetical protein